LEMCFMELTPIACCEELLACPVEVLAAFATRTPKSRIH
jgi:hypothetical protein